MLGVGPFKMADTEELLVEGKPISGLRVVDLKQELEKRGLSKSGTKKELHDRLKMQLQLEKLQENASKNEGELPNLAMQDEELAEQSDVVKEYLANQQQIYERQKEVRRKIELEEEEKEKSTEEKQDSNVESLPKEDEEMKDIEKSSSQETGKEDEALVTDIPADESPEKKDEKTASKASDCGSNADTPKSEEANETVSETTAEIQLDKDKKHSSESENVSEGKAHVSKDDEASSTNEAEEEPCKMDTDVKNNENEEEICENKDKSEVKSELEKDACKENDETEIKRDSEEELNKAGETKTKNEVEETHDIPEKEDTKQEISRSRSRSPSPERSNSQDSSRRSRSSSSSSCSSNSSSSSSNSSKSRSGSHSNRSRSRSKSPDKQDEKRNRSVSKSPERVDTTEAEVNKEEEENKTISEDVPVEKKTDNECEQQKMEESEETSEEKPEEVKKIQEKNLKSDDVEVEERKESQNEDAEPVDAEQPEDNSQKSQENSAKPVMKITMRKISINSSKESHKNKENIDVSSDGDKPARKRKWGSSTTKAVKKTSLSISTDSLKNLIPDVAPLPAVVIGDSLPDIQEASTPETEEAKEMTAVKDLKIRRTVTQVVSEEPMIIDQPETEQTKSEVPEQVVQMKPLLATTTTKPAEEPLERPRSPSPARNPVNKIIHIRNLVRPFTLNQLKELLARTGTLVERGFWIDKIKSKCYATYESVEQAVATRQALHGVQWPPSNRKNLIVDYADEDEFNFHVNLTETTEIHKPDLRKELPLRDSTRRVRENVTAIPNTHLSKSKERPPLPPPIREWDRDKIGERSPGEKLRARHHRSKSPISPSRDRKRDRSKEHKEKREKRDRKKEEETPSKLLDDLFKKTKSTPCIYWLPLTLEQIKIRDEENKKREEERKKKQIEREKRRQELEKEKGKDSTSDSKKTRNGDEKSNKRRSASPSRSRNRKR